MKLFFLMISLWFQVYYIMYMYDFREMCIISSNIILCKYIRRKS